MSAQVPDLSTELLLLFAHRKSRAEFYDQVVSQAESHREAQGEPELTREERKALRSEGLLQIAEFFFAIDEAGISEPERIRGFLERHNEDMNAMLETCERGYTKFGLSAARIKEAILKPHQIELIAHESEGGQLTFDQRSIGKVLTPQMSFETCRTLLVLMASAGLIRRRDFRSVVLISSNGVIEKMYKTHLSQLLGTISDA